LSDLLYAEESTEGCLSAGEGDREVGRDSVVNNLSYDGFCPELHTSVTEFSADL
jgi:peptide deformylase